MPDFSFRSLFHELEGETQWRRIVNAPLQVSDAPVTDVYRDVLLRSLDDTLRALEPLRAYGDAEARHWRKQETGSAYADQHQLNLWSLYALSRVSDLLLVPFAPVGDTAQFAPFHSTWVPFPLDMQERTAWFLALGMHAIEARTFHPFYHEIVAVESSPDPDEPITLVETLWPGFMLGQMLFCRAGVKVHGGSQRIVKHIAETSTLYFTYRRNNRPTRDLSHHWGHNSQWGTDFRRDYEDTGMFYYNVDRAWSVDEPRPDFDEPPDVRPTAAERIEVLRHRCFVTTDKPHDDLWPFDDTYQEPQPRQ